MSYSKGPGDIETELPGDWPPCAECASTGRVALAKLTYRGIAFFCNEGHRQQWQEDNGATGLWIKHYHFWPDGQFGGLLPDNYVGIPKAKDRDRRFDINERRADWIHNEQAACSVCGVPPMRDPHDGKALLNWLREYHGDLFDDVVAFINAMRPRPTYTTWFTELIKQKNDVAHEVTRRIRDAKLEADHGIPKVVLRELWDDWTRPMRMAATNTLAFGVCRPHNNGKSKRLPSREELLRRHVQVNYDGDSRRAQADTERWEAVARVLDSIEAFRPTYEQRTQKNG